MISDWFVATSAIQCDSCGDTQLRTVVTLDLSGWLSCEACANAKD